MYDFIVVGAGPPGSYFARQAVANGYDVLLLERGVPGEPLACSGHVSTDIWSYLSTDARSTLLQNEIHGARFHVGGPGSRAYRFDAREPISQVIDRVELDRHLATAAVDAGVDLRVNHTVVDIVHDTDGVTVYASTDGGTTSFRGRMVAGCDGPRSTVRQSVGLADPEEMLHGILGFSNERDAGDFVDVHLTIDRFFCWRIPRGEEGVEYGLAGPPGSFDPRSRLQTLTDGYGTAIQRRCAGLIPLGPPARVTHHRVFLIGDAAGHTKPYTGGGILYGLRAAEHASRVIDPSNPATLARYERTWRRDLMRDIRLGKWLRRCYGLPAPVQHLGLWLTQGKIGVHMDRPTTVFSRRHLRAVLGLD